LGASMSWAAKDVASVRAAKSRGKIRKILKIRAPWNMAWDASFYRGGCHCR